MGFASAAMKLYVVAFAVATSLLSSAAALDENFNTKLETPTIPEEIQAKLPSSKEVRAQLRAGISGIDFDLKSLTAGVWDECGRGQGD